MSRLGFQIYTDRDMETMIADWTHIAVGTVFETGIHGFGSLSTFVPMSYKRAEYFYTTTPFAHIVLSNGASVAYEGRVEDRAIVNEPGKTGLEITAFGYWNALKDAPYSALWTWSAYGEWSKTTEADDSYVRPEKYIMDNNNRLYIEIRQDTKYKHGGHYGEWFLRVPHLGERSLIEAEYTYNVTLPTNWEFRLVTREFDFTSAAADDTITGNGASQTGTKTVTAPAFTADREMVAFNISNQTGDVYRPDKEFVGVKVDSNPANTDAWVAITANQKRATLVTAKSTFTATKMTCQMKADFNSPEKMKMGIYADSTGSPGALLGTTDEVNGTGEGHLRTANLTAGVSIVSGTSYWMAIITDSNCSVRGYSGGYTSKYLNDTYSDGFLDPFGSGNAATDGIAVYALADEWFVEITDIEVRTTANNDIYADEIAKDLVSFISTLNSSQLSSSTALIQSPNEALTDIEYNDAYPADILADLAALGDDSTPTELYETGVWEDQVVFFRPLGDNAQTWYVDASKLRIDSTAEKLRNSAYGIYRDPRGFLLRTLDSDDDASIAKYGITRRAAVSKPARTDLTGERGRYALSGTAQVYRDAFLEDNKDITPRAQVAVKEIFTASGARANKWGVRAGHILVLRNLSPTGNSDLDKVSSFYIGHTRYYVDTGVLEPTPALPTTSLDVLVAQHAAKLG